MNGKRPRATAAVKEFHARILAFYGQIRSVFLPFRLTVLIVDDPIPKRCNGLRRNYSINDEQNVATAQNPKPRKGFNRLPVGFCVFRTVDGERSVFLANEAFIPPQYFVPCLPIFDDSTWKNAFLFQKSRFCQVFLQAKCFLFNQKSTGIVGLGTTF